MQYMRVVVFKTMRYKYPAKDQSLKRHQWTELHAIIRAHIITAYPGRTRMILR
jgi:hypothetical protein